MIDRIGQKVICIDPTWGDGRGSQPRCPNVPVLNGVYTVRSISWFTAVRTEGPTCWIRLFEVVNPPNPSLKGPVEPYFEVEKYRPVVDRPTSIEIFTALLLPATRRLERV